MRPTTLPPVRRYTLLCAPASSLNAHFAGPEKLRPVVVSLGPADTLSSFPYPAFSARRRPKTAQTRKTATSAAPVAKAKPTFVGSPAK